MTGESLALYTLEIRNAALEEAAKVCDALAAAKWKAYERPGPSQCNPSLEAGSDALDEASTAIRALKSQEPQHDR